MTGRFYSLEELIIAETGNAVTTEQINDNQKEVNQECDAIIKAWQAIESEIDRAVLFYSYFDKESHSVKEITFMLNCSRRTIERYKQRAVIEFGKFYENGALS
ncbi:MULTISPECIES: hypothetical protein [unclassified Enterococcus]|uniref:hypothetical protein n=1 Tax=unclassified Enterococcus TaxID=2608891 RepID=UPI00247431EA|nr:MULTISPECIES: hypothetical protein [unclassified Enterococcus]